MKFGFPDSKGQSQGQTGPANSLSWLLPTPALSLRSSIHEQRVHGKVQMTFPNLLLYKRRDGICVS